MAMRIMQERIAQASEMATVLGARIAPSEERNLWNVVVAEKHAGQIRFEPRARVWLATAGAESTIGDLQGCIKFVIDRC